MPGRHKSRHFQDLSPQETESLKDLLHHPGWPIYVLRLQWMQAFALQDYLDTNDVRKLGRVDGLKEALTIPKWMLMEGDPELKKKLKEGTIEIPNDALTAEDIQRLEQLNAEA